MTIKEIRMVVDAYIEKRKLDDKQLKATIYNQAYLTSMFVGSILGGKSIPQIDKVFPEMTQEPQDENHGKTNGVDNSVIIIREKMREFAKHANERRKNK